MWRHPPNRPKQGTLSGARFDMPWARTAEETPVAQVMFGIVEGLRRLPAENMSKMVWKRAWAAVPTDLYRVLPYFGAGFRGWMGDCVLEWW